MRFKPTEHPIILVPTVEQVRACAASMKVDAEDAFIFLHKKREEIIRQEKADPFNFGWEPPMWKVCDALLGFDDEKYGFISAEFGQAMREHLTFPGPVKALLISGGNRGGKSEYAAKRSQQILNVIDGARSWPFHSSSVNSIEYQQPLFMRYMPAHLKGKAIRSDVTYISYKQKLGFSDAKFVLPNASECSFRNYGQDREMIEGGEIDVAWPDELVPPDWVDTLFFRIATREGVMIITFTPVKGYTPTVKLFGDGAEVVKESVAYLCPKDGGDPYLPGALAREDCLRWLTDGKSQVPIPEGRKFEMIPRVMKCHEKVKAMVFFHTSDNPFGNPQSVVDILHGAAITHVRERWYGVANKTASSRFPTFCKSHILPAASIPEGGTNYQIMDPADGRNFFMIWIRRLKKKWYVYREWPGNYDIPEIGVPGEWAIPHGKKPDGRKGPAQDPFGWGFKAYKKEIARLEGWKDYLSVDNTGEDVPLLDWDVENGSKEKVYERFIDSRAASAPKLVNDCPVTLQDELQQVGLDCMLTPGDSIAEGVACINDLLDFNAEEPISFMNCPDLYISEECINLIYSMQTWTGLDGNKGASKDPIDVLRYGVLAGLDDEGGYEELEDVGGYY